MALDLRTKGVAVFCVLVFVFTTVNYYLFQGHGDPARCKALVEDGFWLDPEHVRNWQPAGCMMHHYKIEEAIECLEDRHVMIIGGLHALEVYSAFGRKLDEYFEPPSPKHQANLVNTVNGVRLDFIWDPDFNGGKLDELEAGYDQTSARPAITLVFPSHEIIREDENLNEWSGTAEKLAAKFAKQKPQKDLQSDVLLVSPLLRPDLGRIPNANRDIYNPVQFEYANEVLRAELKKNDVDGAYAFDLMTRLNGTLDGLHLTEATADLMTNLLINRRCNSQLPKRYPFSSTCCNTYPKPSWVQVVFFAFICLVLPAAHLVQTTAAETSRTWIRDRLPSGKHLGAAITLGMSAVLSYYCDRTNIFGKEQKQTDPGQFFFAMFVIICASLCTLKTSDKDEPFLNRHQTDEWKGWMQVAILVYHYVGVSKTKWIYNYMRVCPTSYLFMTGFGNTFYFLKKGDYSFKRIFATMLRLNLLNVILAYAMGTDWLLYYFAPLVTWNFFVLYFTLWIGEKYNSDFKLFVAKTSAVAVLNTALYKTPGVLEAVWWVLQTVFRMEGDLREWRFRVTLDQYSIIPGMLAAWVFLHWKELEIYNSKYWRVLQPSAVCASIVIMVGYAAFETSFNSKIEYNRYHPYTAWLPCCAFVILRNATPWLRRTHNTMFAWFGKGSLETFLLQFHLWLGADTVGLLNVGLPHHRLINFLVASVPFLFISSLATNATAPVIEWIMGTEPKPISLPLVSQPKLEVIIEEKAEEVEEASRGGGDTANGGLEQVGEKTELMKDTEAEVTEIMEDLSTARRSKWEILKDARLRAGVMLAIMAFANWTY